MFDQLGVSIAVRSVLELEIFRRAEAFVAAGEAGLGRPVRWVHAAEIPDIARFLSGGELLLTAGHGLGESESEQRAYISSLAEAGVAGLAMELTGRRFSSFPAAAVEEADRLGMPLIGLLREVPFVQASAQVVEVLTDATMRQITRTVDINRVLTDRLVAGADHISLVRTVSQNVGRAIALESADHDLQAYYGANPDTEPMLADWVSHARSRTIHSPEGDHGNLCLRRPVMVQGAIWGYLHMPWDETCTSIDQTVVEQGAASIAISLLSERGSGARSRHQQGILVSRLMLGDISGRGFVDRALRLGKDLRKSHLVIVIGGTHNDADTDLEHQISDDLRTLGFEFVGADIGDAALYVVALHGDRAVARLAGALTAEDRYLGFSKVVEADELPAAIQQAKAASLARQPCQFFDRLGLLRLLVPLSNSSDLAAYVEDELGALLQHDHAHNSRLFDTLAAFLDCDGNKTSAAKTLFIQRRTLYYRLERIGQILGLNLEDGEVRLRLQVAIRAAELLHHSRGVRAWNGGWSAGS